MGAAKMEIMENYFLKSFILMAYLTPAMCNKPG